MTSVKPVSTPAKPAQLATINNMLLIPTMTTIASNVETQTVRLAIILAIVLLGLESVQSANKDGL